MEPGFESPFQSLGIFVVSMMPPFTQSINEDLAIDSGGIVSE